MLKFFLVLILFIFSIASFAQGYGANSNDTQLSRADNDKRLLPRSFTRSILFGVGAGTLVGIAAITNFKRDFAKNVDYGNISRGASYGLYAGIILGIYVTYFFPEDNENSTQENDLEANAKPANLQKNPTYASLRIKKQRQAKTLPLMIDPIIEDNYITGLALNWTVVKF